MPDDEIEESVEETEKEEETKTILVEDGVLVENDDLPTPEEADDSIDFTENY